jgi:predicted small lipoprotein YifL
LEIAMKKSLLILLVLGLAALAGCLNKGDLLDDEDLPLATATDDAA